MGLDLGRLQNVKTVPNGWECACPVCRTNGHDSKGNHLHIWSDGRWSCVIAPGDKEHNRAIWALVGDGSGGDGESAQDTPRQLAIPKTWDRSVLAGLIQDHSYWVNRGVEESVLPALQGGVATRGQMKGRYTFPIFDLRDPDTIIGFNGRRIDGRNEMKWKAMGKTSTWVWGGVDAIQDSGRAILVESMGDALALMSHDYPDVLCLFGANISQAVIGALISANPQRILVATNNDTKHRVGQTAAMKIATILTRFFNSEAVEVQLPTQKDFGEMTDQDFKKWNEQIFR